VGGADARQHRCDGGVGDGPEANDVHERISIDGDASRHTGDARQRDQLGVRGGLRMIWSVILKLRDREGTVEA
jgi:hypothetical protein